MFHNIFLFPFRVLLLGKWKNSFEDSVKGFCPNSSVLLYAETVFLLLTRVLCVSLCGLCFCHVSSISAATERTARGASPSIIFTLWNTVKGEFHQVGRANKCIKKISHRQSRTKQYRNQIHSSAGMKHYMMSISDLYLLVLRIRHHFSLPSVSLFGTQFV